MRAFPKIKLKTKYVTHKIEEILKPIIIGILCTFKIAQSKFW